MRFSANLMFLPPVSAAKFTLATGHQRGHHGWSFHTTPHKILLANVLVVTGLGFFAGCIQTAKHHPLWSQQCSRMLTDISLRNSTHVRRALIV